MTCAKGHSTSGQVLERGRPERIADVGVEGVHRLLGRLEAIQSANVVIVVEG